MAKKLLSKAQKALVSQLARRAWQRAKEHELTEASEKDWRGAEAIECCKCRVSEAPAFAFAPLMAHFANLAGDAKAALEWHAQAEKEKLNQFLWTLDQCLNGKPRAYAQAMANDMFHLPLTEISPDQRRVLLINVRQRVAAK